MNLAELEMRQSSRIKPFIWEGKKRRIRRYRRLSFIISIVGALIFTGIVVGLSVFLMYSFVRFGRSASDVVTISIYYLIAAPLTLFYYIKPTLGRLRDLNASPIWLILVFIPFVNIIFWLVLMFVKGTNGPNQYGPPPISWEEIKEIRRNRISKQN